FPKVRAQELIDSLTTQMEQFEQTICLEESVNHLEKLEDGSFKLTTNAGEHLTKSVIITAGNGAFQPRRLEIEGSERFEKANLHYFVNDMSKFKDMNVVVFGGGDSAVDWALMLEEVAASVTIVHRRDKFRAHEHSVQNLMDSTVQVKTPYVPAELVGDERITAVVLEHVTEGTKETIPVDAVIVNYGFVSSLGPIKEWGLDISKNSIVVNSKQETNIPGIFAAGDICTYEGKVKLIASGFGEAPVAVNQAKVYADPTAKITHLHSTSLFDK
ncbi:MAG: NAD(P)/FAD-dependent oxidoreductase, partial [Bacilli bacterium]